MIPGGERSYGLSLRRASPIRLARRPSSAPFGGAVAGRAQLEAGQAVGRLEVHVDTVFVDQLYRLEREGQRLRADEAQLAGAVGGVLRPYRHLQRVAGADADLRLAGYRRVKSEGQGG